MSTRDFISLRASLEQAEYQHALFRTALHCYLEALVGVQEHVLTPCAAKIGGQALSIDRERKKLAEDPCKPSFAAAREGLKRALEATHELIAGQLAGTVELREVVRLLEETAVSLQHRSSRRESQFLGVASDLERAAEREDLRELRHQILAQIRCITRLVEEMRQENQQIIAELEREMSAYRRRLDEVEQAAQRDPLTGLANRSSFERRVEEFIQAGVTFTLLMIDLNRFKMVNDRYGHLAGDELLRLFAARLKRQLRADDMAARWGGDEFVVLLPCRLRDAMTRARFLEQALGGDYQFVLGGETLRLRVGVAMGLAEYRQGETLEAVMARADQALYQRKAER